MGKATTSQLAKCLMILREVSEPIVAAELADRLNFSGNRESKRRRVRSLIKTLREQGEWIVATLQGGYWLTNDENLFADYINGRQIDAKRVLAESHRRKRSLADQQSGQGVLFGVAGNEGIPD